MESPDAIVDDINAAIEKGEYSSALHLLSQARVEGRLSNTQASRLGEKIRNARRLDAHPDQNASAHPQGAQSL